MVSQVNLSSEAACRRAYLNYHCYGNTMNLTPQEMGEITSTWSNKISSWQTTVNKDINEYEFDDSEYAQYKNEGEQAGKAATGGYDKKQQGGDIAKATGDALFSAAGATATAGGAQLVLSCAGKGAGGFAGKLASVGMKEGAKNFGLKNISSYVAIALGVITAATYWIKKPNMEEKEACDKLQAEMAGAQGELAYSQEEMEAIEQELIALSDEAAEINEQANQMIAGEKAEFDLYRQSYDAIKAKADAGEELTDSEKMLFTTCAKYMQDAGANIEETSADTTDEVGEINDEIGGYQENYDDIAESMGEIEGLTDYAASFDKSTQALCYVEGAAQTLNAASTGMAAARLAMTSGIAWWNYLIVAAGAAAAASSGVAAGQQFKMAGEVGKEIEMREATQEFNTETMSVYDESIDGYDGVIQGVSDLEMVIPNDLDAPEETTLPAAAAAASQAPVQQSAPAKEPEKPSENTNKVKKKGNAGM